MMMIIIIIITVNILSFYPFIINTKVQQGDVDTDLDMQPYFTSA